jgi:hypothetical protein
LEFFFDFGDMGFAVRLVGLYCVVKRPLLGFSTSLFMQIRRLVGLLRVVVLRNNFSKIEHKQ